MAIANSVRNSFLFAYSMTKSYHHSRQKDLTSQNHRMSVSSEETSPEVYFWNSVSTLDSCDKGEVLYSILNRVGRDFPPAIGGGWTGASDATVAAPTGIRLRYWCIYTRC